MLGGADGFCSIARDEKAIRLLSMSERGKPAEDWAGCGATEVMLFRGNKIFINDL
jgi:hypothetical protein